MNNPEKCRLCGHTTDRDTACTFCDKNSNFISFDDYIKKAGKDFKCKDYEDHRKLGPCEWGINPCGSCEHYDKCPIEPKSSAQ